MKKILVGYGVLVLVVLFNISGCMVPIKTIPQLLALNNPGCDLSSGYATVHIYEKSFEETWDAINGVMLDLEESVKMRNEEARIIKTEVTPLSHIAGRVQGMEQMDYSLYIRVVESFDSQRLCTVYLTIALVDNQPEITADLEARMAVQSPATKIANAKEAIGRLFFCKLNQRLVPPARKHPPIRTHTVRQRDSLSEISKLYYDTTQYWQQLAVYNKLSNEYSLMPGELIEIPGIETLDAVKVGGRKSPKRRKPKPVQDISHQTPEKSVPVINEPEKKDTRELLFTTSYSNPQPAVINGIAQALTSIGAGVEMWKGYTIHSIFINRDGYRFKYFVRLASTGSGTNVNIRCLVEDVDVGMVTDSAEDAINQFTFDRLFPAIDSALN